MNKETSPKNPGTEASGDLLPVEKGHAGDALMREVILLRQEKARGDERLREQELRAEKNEVMLAQSNAEMMERVTDLLNTNAQTRDARRGALNLMEDAIHSREALRKSEARQTFLLQLGDALRPLASADQIQKTAARILGGRLGVTRAFYFTVERDEQTGGYIHVIKTDSYRQPEMTSIVGRYPPPGGEDFYVNLPKGENLVVRDVNKLPAAARRYKERYLSLDIQSLIAVPLVRNGAYVAGFGVNDAVPRDWTGDEITLVKETAERTWEAVERARAEEALARSEEQYRMLFNSIDEGFCTIEVIFDTLGNAVDYRFLEANPAFTRQTGLENALGKRMRELLPGHEEFWFETYGRIAKTGQAMRFEHQASALGKFYDVYAFRIGRPGENRVAILFNDIFQRKRVEANLAFLAEVSQELAHMEDMLATMEVLAAKICAYFKTSHCLFGEVDEKNDAVTVAAEWMEPGLPSLKGTYRVDDYHNEEFRRDSRAGITYVVNDTAHDPRCSAANMAALCVGAFVIVPAISKGEWKLNLTIINRTARRWREDEIELFEEISARIWARFERARAEIALADHCAQLWEALQENEQAREELEKAGKAKDHLLALLSHELRTPLTPIAMAARLLMRKADIPDETREALEMIQRNVELETQLIDDLLDITRIGSGKLELTRKPVDLHEAIRMAEEVVRDPLAEKSQRLVLELEAADHQLDGDFKRLQQVFWNLLKNASKFTPAGGTITIRTRNESAPPRIVVEISDTGIGFNPEVAERIFDAFAQANDGITREYGGLGLGLAISKASVNAHGGTLHASSPGDGQGATFVSAFPLAPDANRMQTECKQRWGESLRRAHEEPS